MGFSARCLPPLVSGKNECLSACWSGLKDTMCCRGETRSHTPLLTSLWAGGSPPRTPRCGSPPRTRFVLHDHPQVRRREHRLPSRHDVEAAAAHDHLDLGLEADSLDLVRRKGAGQQLDGRNLARCLVLRGGGGGAAASWPQSLLPAAPLSCAYWGWELAGPTLQQDQLHAWLPVLRYCGGMPQDLLWPQPTVYTTGVWLSQIIYGVHGLPQPWGEPCMAAVAGYLGQPCLSFGTSAQKLDHFEGLRKAEVGRTRAPVLLRCSFAIALGISLGKRAARPHCFESSRAKGSLNG